MPNSIDRGHSVLLDFPAHTNGRRVFLCRKKKWWNELAETKKRGNRRAHRRASLCGKKCITCARVSMAPARRSRQLRSAYPKHGAPGSTWLRPSNGHRRKHARKRHATRGRAGQAITNGLPLAPGQPRKRCDGRAIRQLLARVCLSMLILPPTGAVRAHVSSRHEKRFAQRARKR